ncbi:MAG: DNA phosphorothioation-dependent restriction protein DptH [Fusobacteriaceae bacterium]|nr:DNA phosphorothioation-dependent restriction protein DptH [Fusobacteriaceae bacterium]
MSNQFYDYLITKILNYFTDKGLEVGESYNLTLENSERVQFVYNAFKNINHEIFNYGVYSTISFKFGNNELIIAATVNGVKEDYLLTLRNLIKDAKDENFKNKGIVFIHSSTLDSITGGSSSLTKQGMPLCIQAIKEDIELKTLDFKKHEKEIIKFTSNKFVENTHLDNTSIFEYENILQIIDKGQIEPEDYPKLELFFDKNLETFEKKDINVRIKENSEFYNVISLSRQYGNFKDEMQEKFTDDIVDKLIEDDWKLNIDFEDLRISSSKKNNGENLTYIESKKKESIEKCIYWERAGGETKAQKKKRHILVFNPERFNTINLEFEFEEFLKQDFIKTNTNAKFLKINPSGKKLKVEIIANFDGVKAGKIRFGNNKETYEFNIWLLNFPSGVIEELKEKYFLDLKKNNEKIELKNLTSQLGINIKNSDSITNIDLDKNIALNITDEEGYNINFIDTEDEINLSLLYKNEKLDLVFSGEVDRAKELSGLEIWTYKREYEANFIKKGLNELDNKYYLHFEGKDYLAKNEFKKFLLMEEELLKESYPYLEKIGNNSYVKKDLSLSEELLNHFNLLVNYFLDRNTLPSLCFMDEELKELYTKYLELYNNELGKLGSLGKEVEKSLIRLGVIRELDGDREIFHSPLFPLNIRYQLELEKQINKERLTENVSKNLKSDNLLPYIYYDKSTLYRAYEQSTAMEWSIFIAEDLNKYNSSREFVSKLVKTKLEEFIEHFNYLFKTNKDAPIKINLVNMGDCKEIVQGIFLFYLNQLKKKSVEELLTIEFYIYSKEKEMNAFDEISIYNSTIEIKNQMEIEIKDSDITSDELLDVYRNKVRYYQKDINSIEYSHLTFFDMDKSVIENTYEDSKKLNTGISLEGVLSNLVPMYIENSYKTGFGINGIKSPDKLPLIKLSKRLNELARVSEKQDPFEVDKVIVTAISEEKNKELKQIYEKSNWVTFVKPKVDINFFKQKENSDLLIIHYSDQYTNSSGYDAITVTQKSKLYQIIIKEFLTKKLKSEDLNFDNLEKTLINYFNAINGDWLLKLSMSNNDAEREKISILSAVNLSLAKLSSKKITWVPISLEELFRITGSAGLSQKDGVFSAKNLGITGKMSDDLLMIGIEWTSFNTKLHIHPIEVKIGKNQSGVIDKAIEQGNKTYETISDIFKGSSFKNKFYRNFLIQVLYLNIEKLKLYNIGEIDKWDGLLNQEIKNRLFNDNYEYSEEEVHQNGKFGIVSFKKDKSFREFPPMKDNYTLAELPEYDGYQLLGKSIKEIREKFLNLSDLVEKDEKMKESSFEAIDKSENSIMVVENETNQNLENSEVISKSSKGIEIKFGKEVFGDELLWYPNNTDKLSHTNTGIIGTMGTGKTQFTKSLITQLYLDRKNNVGNEKIGILIFDYNADYVDQDFLNLTNAKVYRPYKLPYNPLYLNNQTKRPLMPLHTANLLKETITKTFRLGQVQEHNLQEIIVRAYNLKGIDEYDESTWDKIPPTFSDVYNTFIEEIDPKKDSLFAAMDVFNKFKIFEEDAKKTGSLYDLLNGVIVINLDGYNSDFQNLVVGTTLDLFYSQMQAEGHSQVKNQLREIRRMILVDEADNFLSQNFTSIKKILKEGRKYGVGTILSTQFLSHFNTGENEYSDYIESWIVHKVAKITNKEVKSIFATNSKAEEDELIGKITELEKHYSLVKAGNSGVKYIKDYAFWELIK